MRRRMYLESRSHAFQIGACSPSTTPRTTDRWIMGRGRAFKKKKKIYIYIHIYMYIERERERERERDTSTHTHTRTHTHTHTHPWETAFRRRPSHGITALAVHLFRLRLDSSDLQPKKSRLRMQYRGQTIPLSCPHDLPQIPQSPSLVQSLWPTSQAVGVVQNCSLKDKVWGLKGLSFESG